jgi:hypothetical protein
MSYIACAKNGAGHHRVGESNKSIVALDKSLCATGLSGNYEPIAGKIEAVGTPKLAKVQQTPTSWPATASTHPLDQTILYKEGAH